MWKCTFRFNAEPNLAADAGENLGTSAEKESQRPWNTKYPGLDVPLADRDVGQHAVRSTRGHLYAIPVGPRCAGTPLANSTANR